MKTNIAPRVFKLPLNLIDLPEFDVRYRRDEKKIEELKKSMKSLGQLVPILVKRMNGGRYRVIDGVCRVTAARELGWDSILATESVSEDDIDIPAAVQANLKRFNLTPLDVAKVARKLIDEEGWALETVARVLNLSKATVSKCLTIDERLDLEDKEKLLKGKLTFRQAYAKVAAKRVSKPRLRPCHRCGQSFELKELKPIFLCPSCYEYIVQERLGGGK